MLGGVWRERLGSFFHRESHRRELTERACQRRVGCFGVLVGKVWGIFFTGRATGESLQKELVRGVWGAWGCWWGRSGEFFSQGELQERAYRESLSEACGVLKALVIQEPAEQSKKRNLKQICELIISNTNGCRCYRSSVFLSVSPTPRSLGCALCAHPRSRGANELPPLPWLGSDWLQVSLS